MNKTDFINIISTIGDITKVKAATVYEGMMEAMRDSLADGDDVRTAIGTLKVVERAARDGRNPQTGEIIKIPAKQTVKFVPNAEMKQAVNE
jgi:DNA-binding protein HU-beta